MGTLSCDPALRPCTAPLCRRLAERLTPETGLRLPCEPAMQQDVRGPGLYVLPSTVGFIKHDWTRAASPAFSLAGRPSEGRFGGSGLGSDRVSKTVAWAASRQPPSILPASTAQAPQDALLSLAPPPDFSPGPAYFLDPRVTRFGRSCAPAYSMQGRGRCRGLEVTPGPGAYSPEKVPPVRQRTPPAFTLGPRLRLRPLDAAAPAPNAYTMPPLWGSQVLTKPSSPSYTVVGRTRPARPPQDPAATPGPGQYDSPDPSTYRGRPPAFTMLGRPRPPRPPEETPGPGSHCPEQVTVNKARAPAYTMGIRHSRRAATMAAATTP